jgi:cytoskeletal protein RodZ
MEKEEKKKHSNSKWRVKKFFNYIAVFALGAVLFAGASYAYVGQNKPSKIAPSVIPTVTAEAKTPTATPTETSTPAQTKSSKKTQTNTSSSTPASIPANSNPTPAPSPVKICVDDTSTIAVLEAQRKSELMKAEVTRTNGINAIPYQDSSYYQRRVAAIEMEYQNTMNSVNSVYDAKINAVPKICTTK